MNGDWKRNAGLSVSLVYILYYHQDEVQRALFARCLYRLLPICALQHLYDLLRHIGPLDLVRRLLSIFRRPFVPVELKRFDAVVFDPPRQGAEAQAHALAGSAVATVVAVSCNPGTFARDARILIEGGYRLVQVTPVDQFLWSPHVELAAVFRTPARTEK